MMGPECQELYLKAIAYIRYDEESRQGCIPMVVQVFNMSESIVRNDIERSTAPRREIT